MVIGKTNFPNKFETFLEMNLILCFAIILDMNITINKDKCIKCGRCGRVCTMGVIVFKDNEPVVERDSSCFHCHHCYAACPTNAIEVDGLVERQQSDIRKISPDETLSLLEHRYSCREFKKSQLSESLFTMLKRALNAAPTGCNARSTKYLIFDTPDKIDGFRTRLKEVFAEADTQKLKANPILRAFALMMKRGLDPVLRGAPHLIISTYDKKAPTGLIDSVIGLSHFEIVAQSMGLGTCWCGFIPMLVDSVWGNMADDLGLPENMTVGYAMLFGEKEFDYPRDVSPNPII